MKKTTGSNYKMSKATKTGLALHAFRNAEDRNRWKRAMIVAEMTASAPFVRDRAPAKK